MELQGILLLKEMVHYFQGRIFLTEFGTTKPKISHLSSIHLLDSLQLQVVGSMYLQPTVGLSKQNIVWQSTGKWSVGYVDLQGIKV